MSSPKSEGKIISVREFVCEEYFLPKLLFVYFGKYFSHYSILHWIGFICSIAGEFHKKKKRSREVL